MQNPLRDAECDCTEVVDFKIESFEKVSEPNGGEQIFRLQNVLYHAAFLNEQQRSTGSNQPTIILDNRLFYIFSLSA